MRVAVRTNAGAGIGFGHLRRCITLAQHLAQRGAQVRFICNGPRAVHELLSTERFQCASVDPQIDLDEMRKLVREWQPAVFVVDSYELRDRFLAALRQERCTVVVIDDLAGDDLAADMIVNSGLNVSGRDYGSHGRAELLLGPNFALLRKEFAAEPQRAHLKAIGRVLITLGGSDPNGLTEKLAEWVKNALPSATLDVVMGPFFENVSTVQVVADRLGRVNLFPSPPNMRDLMLQVDLAVSGGGQTCYELAATGTPAIGICMAENQRANLMGFAREGTLLVGGDATDPSLRESLLPALKALEGNVEARQRMSAQGRKLVDGLGARRVAEAIERKMSAWQERAN